MWEFIREQWLLWRNIIINHEMVKDCHAWAEVIGTCGEYDISTSFSGGFCPRNMEIQGTCFIG
jgi:hypothetical protein